MSSYLKSQLSRHQFLWRGRITILLTQKNENWFTLCLYSNLSSITIAKKGTVMQITYLCFSLCKIRTSCFKPLLILQSHGFKCIGFGIEATELRTHVFKPDKMISYMTWFRTESPQEFEIEFKNMIQNYLLHFKISNISRFLPAKFSSWYKLTNINIWQISIMLTWQLFPIRTVYLELAEQY